MTDDILDAERAAEHIDDRLDDDEPWVPLGLHCGVWWREHKKDYLHAMEKLLQLRATCGSPPHRAGVYFLFLDDELVYVGQSASLSTRLGAHGSYRGTISHNSIAWIAVPDFFMTDVEQYYYDTFRPSLNRRRPQRNKR